MTRDHDQNNKDKEVYYDIVTMLSRVCDMQASLNVQDEKDRKNVALYGANSVKSGAA